MTEARLVRASDLRPTPWRNGRGVTRDVLTHLGPNGALDWQISIADLTQDAEFSEFPHCERAFTLVEGDPVELDFEGRASTRCALLVPARFPGDWPTRCRLTGAPARAFNVVAERRRHVNVTVHMLADSHPFAPFPATSALHCVSGQVMADDSWILGSKDTLLGPVRSARATGGSATVILVHVAEAPAPGR